MTSKKYLISDGFYREQYPMDTSTDTEKFYSCQWIEQTITLRDFLGDNLLETIWEITAEENPSDVNLQFLLHIQNLMVWYVAQAIEDFDKDSPNDNKVASIRNKRKFYEKIVLEFIKTDEDLVAAQDDDTEPLRDSYNDTTYFFR